MQNQIIGNKKINNAFKWMHKNLFSTKTNTLYTIISVYLLYITIPPFINWAFLTADWFGTSREACSSGGACWAFVTNRINIFAYGFYPQDLLWRPNLVGISAVILIISLLIKSNPYKKHIAITSLVIFPIFSFFTIYGGIFGLEIVETNKWGGLMLTIILSSVGIIAAIPLGILLALGRRSENLPTIKLICTLYIEFIRGVPLITILFMASVMLPLFFPEGMEADKLLRALIAITLFQAAYMAEATRGGLQSIDKGQYEAADSMGLGYWHKTTFIILPQALKVALPGIMNSVIEIFKDTTLVAIIGLTDFLGIINFSNSDLKWIGYATEGYVFAATVYFIFCFAMSKYSMRIEAKLSKHTKR